MIRSKLLQLTVATALIAGAQSATACSTALWLGGATATAGEPSAGTPQFRRYSGRCSITSAAAGQTVIDNSPTAESSFNARFYFYTGGLTGGADIFHARDAGGINVIRVSYDGTNLSFFKNGGAAVTVPAAANRYYGIEVRWTAAGTDMTAIVRGNAAAAATTVSVPGPTGGTIDTAVLGWISGGSVAGNQPNFDEYDSRRTSEIGFRCRGNAVATDTIINLADRIAINNNLSGASLAVGQPDINEDGLVSLPDRIQVNAIILAGTGGTFCGGLN
jgi:hypothetical protein